VWLVNNDRYQHQASIAVLKIKRALQSKIMLYPSLRRSLSKIAHPERAAALVGDDLCKPRFGAVLTMVRLTGALSLAKISLSPRLTRPVNDQIQWLADNHNGTKKFKWISANIFPTNRETTAAGPNAWPKSPKGDPNSTN
jgi:hypothetical protein